MSNMTPREIVHDLDKHIIGQDAAKRAVAIALRNRWRRMQLDEALREEISPKNILMIGPTGVGKTEVARRLARLAGAPFIKVEATKFTEVGYVGRDVESIIRDLVDEAVKTRRDQHMQNAEPRAQDSAEERVIDVLLPTAREEVRGDESHGNADATEGSASRQFVRKQLREGDLDDKEIEIDIEASSHAGWEIMMPPGAEGLAGQLQNVFSAMSSDTSSPKKIKVKDALKLLTSLEAEKLVNEEDIKSSALQAVEQTGIVFIDEMDKITKNAEHSGAEISREGVQRDLLPLIEGCNVTTKYGRVTTDHILFIASGAFHLSKPSDLIPELQGRLPIRVELNALTTEDFTRILTEPDASLTEQYQALMATEEVYLQFTPDALGRIAEIAFQVNEQTENIGARRLHTVMERLLEDVSFNATDIAGSNDGKVVIDPNYVNEHLEDLASDTDLSRYIL